MCLVQVEVPPPPSAVKSEQGSNGKPMLRVFNLITHGGSSHYVTAAERELDTVSRLHPLTC